MKVSLELLNWYLKFLLIVMSTSLGWLAEAIDDAAQMMTRKKNPRIYGVGSPVD